MIKKSLLSLIFLSVIFCPDILLGYPWPVSSFNSQHPINSTLGEYRTGHFHRGVDIGEPTSTDVYAVKTGTVWEKGLDYVKIFGDDGIFYDYVHINPLSSLTPQVSRVTASSAPLGSINSDNHLHLEENDGEFNPLRVGGLSPHTDTCLSNPDLCRTYVYTPLEFFDNDTKTPLMQKDSDGTTIILYGKVDIRVKAKDKQNNGSDCVAPYLIGYIVRDETKTTEILRKTNIKLDNVSTGADFDKVYDINASQSGCDTSRKPNYYHWVTNQMKADDFMNTLDTTKFTEANYYWITVYANDITGENNTAENKYNIDTSKGAESIRVKIMNGTSQTLSVFLAVNPPNGTTPLNGVDLTATVSGTATGTINYTFYCNRNDNGMDVTYPNDFKIDGRNADSTGGTVITWGTATGYSGGATFTVNDVCNYPIAGTYTAKVIAERGSLQAQNTFSITVNAPSDTTGPTTSNLTASPNPTNGVTLVTVRATVNDASSGNSNISAAEYFVDSPGLNGFGLSMNAPDGLNSPTESVEALLDISSWVAGTTRTIYVHGKDAAGNWGALQSIVVTVTSAPTNAPEVRMIYLIPSDKTFKQDYANAIEKAIQHLQIWYRNEMGNEKTFTLRTPVVEFYITSHPAAWYSTNETPSISEDWFRDNVLADGFAMTGGKYNDPNNRWIFYIDADPACGQKGGQGGSGIAVLPANDLRGLTGQPYMPVCPSDSETNGVCRWVGGLGHELGHSFSLVHPSVCDDKDDATACPSGPLMGLGYVTYPNTYLLPDDKVILDPAFTTIDLPTTLPDCSSLGSALPTVTITASDSTATEAGPTGGTFTVTRTGSTVSALTVNYIIGGTATNGSDYMALSGSIIIPAGSGIATFNVFPIDDTLVEGDETVIVTINSNSAYIIGAQSSATVTVTDNVQHTVSLTSGPSGSPNPVTSEGTVNLSVTASDSLGHALSYVWVSTCSGLVSHGVFSNAIVQSPTWTAPINTTGGQQNCNIQVTVSDGNGLVSQNSYTQGINSTGSTSVLNVRPTTLTFTATKGGSNPLNQTFDIWNSGDGTLNWSLTVDQPWLSVTPIAGSSTVGASPVQVTVNVQGLTAGVHSGKITITGNGATNSPQFVNVILTITRPLPLLSAITVNPGSTSINVGGIVAYSAAGTFSDGVEKTIPEGAIVWEKLAPMPTPRRGAGIGVVNGIVYVIGGQNDSGTLNVVEAYDPTTDTWATKTPIPTPRAGLSVGVINGILYTVGGYSIQSQSIMGTLEVYDPVTDTWTPKAPMRLARTELGVGVLDNTLYVVGGQGSLVGRLDSIEAYDLATDTWAIKSQMPEARSGHAVAALNGLLYIIGGGSNTDGNLTTVDAYDPTTNTWTSKAQMSTGRNGLATGVINGKIYAVGGCCVTNTNLVYNTVESFEPAGNIWVTEATLPTARAILSIGVANESIYAIGGYNFGESLTYLGTVEAFSMHDIIWGSSDTAVATIDTSGVATGRVAGTTTIMAVSGTISGSAPLVVVNPTYTLTVSKSGAGNGTVTSSPAGINCGTDCSEVYNNGTLVTLTATPDSSSTFAVWSGDADCVDGAVTMNASKTCTATFNPVSNPDFNLSPTGTSMTLQTGSSGTKTFTVSSVNGFNSAVTLTLSGQPAGVTGSFNPNPVTPPANSSAVSTLTINVGSSISCSTYNLTITATGGGKTHTSVLTLDVTGCGGLKGEYYNNPDLTGLSLTRTDVDINFDWITGSPDAAIEPDTFSIRWTGRMKIDTNETYTFTAITDDGIRLWIDGHLVIDYWQTGGASNNNSIPLTAGLHDIKIEFFENMGDSFVQVYWSSPSTPNAIIPQDHLYPPESSGNAPVLTWTGETGYTSDGVEPQIGNTMATFNFSIRYADSDGDAPMNGYPRVHILKGGVEISGSPFSMSNLEDIDPGIYSYAASLTEGTDYAHYFDAKDQTGLQAIASPTIPTPTVFFNAPDVTSAAGVSMDLDGSGRVDGFDLGRIGIAFDSKPGDPNWNPDADLNGDGFVDESDLPLFGHDFGSMK